MATATVSLKQLQEWMRWVVTDPRGHERALTETNSTELVPLARYTQPEPDCRDFIFGELGVYAEAYFARILEAIEADYPRVRDVAGEEFFAKTVADYLKFYPSKEFNIAEIGRQLPKFLVEYSETAEFESLQSLAELEWALVECFYSGKDKELNPQKFAKLSEPDAPDFSVRFSKSFSVKKSKWPLDEFFEQKQVEIFDPVPQESRDFFIYKKRGEIVVREASALESELFEALAHRTLVSDALVKLDLNEESIAELPQIFSDWIADQIICDIEFEIPTSPTAN